MMTFKACAILGLLTLAIAECSLAEPPEPERKADNSKRPAPAPETVLAGGIDTRPESVAASSKRLTLPLALALTLERNPELRSFSQTVRTGEARIIQAGLRPNPEISLAVEDFFGPYGNDSYSQATLQLSQVIELGDKRSARVAAGSAFQEQLKSDYEIKRIEILSSLTENFVRTAADEHLLRLAEKSVGLARQSLTNIQRRSKAGGVSDLEESKAKVLLARYEIAAEHAEHELESSRKTLAAFWDEEKPQFGGLSSRLFDVSTLPTLDALEARMETSPEIKKWVTEKRLREAERKVAESKAIPNLTLGGGPRRLEQTNDTSWVFQVSVPLTIFDRNQGARREAEILESKVDIDSSATRLRLQAALFALYNEAKHAQTELRVMAQNIIPQAEKALKTAQNGYDQGRFSYLDLADAQRTLVEVRRENIEAACSFHTFVNAIERLLGAPLSENVSQN